jgi:hypothetical protein
MGTAGIWAVSPPPDLAARLFRRLFDAYDLHTGVHVVVVPKGTPVYTGATLSEVARQISDAAGRRSDDAGRA